jgi:hypothetical protein
VVQEDTREVGPVALVDLRAERVHKLHLSEYIHHLGGFLDLYIHSSRGNNRWDNHDMYEDSRVRDRQCQRIHSESTGETTWC